MRRTEINNVDCDALCCQTDYKQIITMVCQDWSRIAQYFALITSREVITAGVLNFKMAASHFVSLRRE